MMIVEFDDVSKRFDNDDSVPDGSASGFAVKNLTFHIREHELIAVVGKTGCGKSTMFNLLIGLIEPTSGSVRVLGKNPFAQFNDLAGKISVVFQSDRLLPWRTTLENVTYGLELRKVPKEERLAAGREWLQRLGLEMHADKWPLLLSGGMRQRVSIARAFATNPDILLCDEPFSALDELTGANLRQEFHRLVKETHKTGVFITHSINEAIDIGDRILVLHSPACVAAEFSVADALKEFSREQLKQKILDVMSDAAPDRQLATIV
jgi:NitT/TauT family transport system ATP-binding protein